MGARRLVYSPDVTVYIQPSLKRIDAQGNEVFFDPIDISEDIIDGVIERRSNDVSTARFTVQSRRLGKNLSDVEDESKNTSENPLLLSSIIRPMDRIMVFLKKVKPKLVFSGYLDLVPLVQFVPEPIVIEASCTLKRLQYTYWDPTLPNVLASFVEMGFIPTNYADGLTIQEAYKPDTGKIEDTGFPKLISFLMKDVGGWSSDSVYIEPLPENWIETARPMLEQVLAEGIRTEENFKSFLSPLMGASMGGGSSDSGPDLGGDGGGLPTELDKGKVLNYLKSNNADPWMIEYLPKYFEVGSKYKVDPRFLIAITILETTWGRYGPAKNNKNPGGLGTSNKYPSWNDSIPKMVTQTWGALSAYDGKYTVSAIGSVWAPISDTRNDNPNWPKNVKSFMKGMGANPEAPVRGPEYEKSLTKSSSGGEDGRSAATGKGAKQDGKLTVYIDAFGGPAESEDDRLSGYQKLDVFARDQNKDSSKRRIEKNADFVERVRDRVNEYCAEYNSKTKDKTKHLDVDFVVATKGQTLLDRQGWSGDLYLAIDHSDARRENNIIYYSVPQQSTKDLGKPGPNAGSGWQKPDKAGGRASVKDATLIKNSGVFIEKLKNTGKVSTATLTNQNPLSVAKPSEASAAWQGSIPGFFYTKTAACAYLQLPNYNDDVFQGEDKTDVWAQQVAKAIFLYYRQFTTSDAYDRDYEYGFKWEQLRPEGFELDPGGDGGDWAGTMWRTLRMQQIADIKPGSQKRGKSRIAGSGGVSDHADDMTYGYAMDLFGTPEDGKTNESASKIVEALGGPKNWGYQDHANEVYRTIYDGYRYTVIWRSNIGGNHYDHIHIGTRKVGDSQGLPFLGTDFSNMSADPGGTTEGNTVLANALKFNAAFNFSFNFPGDPLRSLLLRGQRSLMNDVPLFDSVKEAVNASMRNFCSLPNGDFIAWYPDYFNISRKRPWLRISASELIKCTIDLSDKSLATHVYIIGNPLGQGTTLNNGTTLLLDELFGSGVMTVEMPGILDSFLKPFLDNEDSPQNPTEREPAHGSEEYKKNERQEILDFLELYGARPYKEQNLTLRHPYIEVFYAYHKFVELWASQFLSSAEFTFMPELEPGMIIEVPNYKDETMNFSFYVRDVTHQFSYTGGFTTNAVLIAPGWPYYDKNKKNKNIGMVPVRPPSDATVPQRTYVIKKVNKPNTIGTPEKDDN